MNTFRQMKYYAQSYLTGTEKQDISIDKDTYTHHYDKQGHAMLHAHCGFVNKRYINAYPLKMPIIAHAGTLKIDYDQYIFMKSRSVML